MNLPNIEYVSSLVHDAWIQSKLDKHISSRRSETGEELMVPYEVLSEAAKDLDRSSVQAVYSAILEAWKAEQVALIST